MWKTINQAIMYEGRGVTFDKEDTEHAEVIVASDAETLYFWSLFSLISDIPKKIIFLRFS